MRAIKNPWKDGNLSKGQKHKNTGSDSTGRRLNQQDFKRLFILLVIQLQNFEMLPSAVSILLGGLPR